MFEEMQSHFGLEPVDIANYSPLTLAYIGDGVYELIIRTYLVYQGNAPVNTLNKRASKYAKATMQAKIIDILLKTLTEDEITVYKRGRNAHSFTKAKNATASEYRKATGYEALIGYLYLEKKFDRIMEIVKTGFDAVEGD